MGSLFHVDTDVDSRIINSKMGIKSMAKYDYILKRKKKRNSIYILYMEHMELYKAVRNGYETSEKEEKWHKVYDIKQG